MTAPDPMPTNQPQPAKKRRYYTDAEKLQAVMAAEVLGAAAVRRAQNIPKRTLNKWRTESRFKEHADKSLDEIADGFRVLMGMAQEALVTRIPSMDGRDLTILLGVTTDKHQLLTGKATSRSESRALAGMSDSDVRDALREAERITVAGRAPGGAADPPAGE